jgi:hypothetical protein
MIFTLVKNGNIVVEMGREDPTAPPHQLLFAHPFDCSGMQFNTTSLGNP